MAKRAAAGTLALAVCFTGGLVAATTASAAPGFNFDTRLSGATRLDTAVDASKAAFPSSNTVVVVNSDRFADGLTASYAAGIADDNAGAPILYVNEDGIPDQTKAEIKRLGAKNVIIVGGTAVVPQKVQDELDSFVDNVQRLAGKDRFETSAKVALSGSKDVGTVFIANGDATADALAAGPIAYRSHNPIVLVQKDSAPAAAKDALNQLNEERRIVVGGTAVVSDAGYTSADATSRIRGTNRQGTAIELAKYAIANEAGFDSGNVALIGSQDRNAADALVAAPVAGKAGTPILFTEGNKLGADTAAYLQSIADDLKGTGYIFGGTAAVPENVAGEAKSAAGGDEMPEPPATNQGFNVTPKDDKTLVFVATGDEATNDTSDDRTFGVDGLDDNLEYRITLVKSENINIADDGKVTFKSSADGASKSGFSADTGAPDTTISVVNGSPLGGNLKTSTAKPVGGKLSFSIEGQASETVTPVVYVNGGAGKDADNGGPSIRLETQATKAGDFAEGAEKYGLGGKTVFVPKEATAGPIAGGLAITTVNKAAGYVIANNKTYFYDASDQFRVDGKPVTLAAFAASLSKGDELNAGTYADNPELQSTFDLKDLTPTALGGVIATPVDDTSIKVVWTTPSTAPQSYAVYRKAGTVQTADLKDYTKIADLPGNTSPTTYTDKGLTATTDYTYAVTQTVDGDESALTDPLIGDDTDSVGTAQTSAPGVTAAPQSIAAGVTDDNSFGGTVSTGDVYTIAFNRAINAPAGTTTIRLQDDNGESVDLSNAGTGPSTFTRNTTTVVYNGKTQAPNTVLTVTVGAGPVAIIDRDGNANNNNNSVDYPAKIVAQNGGITSTVQGSVNPVAWNPSTSADNTLETGATTPTASTDVTAPTVTATNYVSATQVKLTMSEAVRGSFGDGTGDGSINPARFVYDADGTLGGDTAATGASVSSDGLTVTLTFGAATVSTTGNAADLIRYTPLGSGGTAGGAGDVVDTSDNRLAAANPAVAGNN